MKVLLVYPPQAQPFLPHLALPSLGAVLRNNGHRVVYKDYNLQAYRDLLEPEFLVKKGISRHNASRVEEYLSVLKSGMDYLDPARYYEAVNVIEDFLSAAASHHYLTRFSLKDYQVPPYREYISKDVLNAAKDREKNLFFDYFENKIDEIREITPGLLGISVSWHSQLIPAFTLAGLVKKHLPHIHICMGGSLISHIHRQLKEADSLFELIDSLIPFEGENSLLSLANELQEGRLNRVPGLIYRWEDTVIDSGPELPELKNIPFADFEGLDLDEYLSPQIYLPVAASRGCYWSRCAFCTHHLSGGAFRPRKAESVFKEMEYQYRRHSCRNFYFVDDSLPPGLIRRVSKMIEDSGLPFRWAGEIRAEKGLGEEFFSDLYRGGCRLILFGLESGCQRTLHRMNKGISAEQASEAVRAASQAGIITWVFFFLGFPGERRHEARETFKFIFRNREHIDMLAGGNFTLTKGSLTDRFPEKYSIRSIERDPVKDLQLSFPYTLSEGIDKDAIRELMRKFRADSRTRKFLHSFVSEPHLLFFKKSCFKELK